MAWMNSSVTRSCPFSSAAGEGWCTRKPLNPAALAAGLFKQERPARVQSRRGPGTATAPQQQAQRQQQGQQQAQRTLHAWPIVAVLHNDVLQHNLRAGGRRGRAHNDSALHSRKGVVGCRGGSPAVEAHHPCCAARLFRDWLLIGQRQRLFKRQPLLLLLRLSQLQQVQ